MSIKQIQTLDALHALMFNDKCMIIKYFATWCGPCKTISPIFHKYASETVNKNIVFVEVDVDASPTIAAKYNVTSMPTFQLFYHGRIIDEFSGASKTKLDAMVKKCQSKNITKSN